MTDTDTNKPHAGITREKAVEPELGQGPIDGFRYNSADFAALEWEQMWTKVWLLLGRISEIPSKGDYQIEEIGVESIIMVRQEDGSVRAFYNVCQHRGSRLTNSTEGNAQVFRLSLIHI